MSEDDAPCYLQELEEGNGGIMSLGTNAHREIKTLTVLYGSISGTSAELR